MCVAYVSAVPQLHVCKCVGLHRVSLCVSLGLLLYLSLSHHHLSPPVRCSGTQRADCSSQHTDGRGGGEERETRVRKRTTAEEGRLERQQGLCGKRGENKSQKKIENQERRTLQGAERSGVWRRGDKGRGLIRQRDKYGAMHHSGNTGRAKTLSHETGKTPGYFFVPTADTCYCATFSPENSVKNNGARCNLTGAYPCVSSPLDGHTNKKSP